MNYSQKVIKLMTDNEITASTLAKALEVKSNVINNWVARESVPERFSVKISDFFKVDLRSLLDEEIKEVVSTGA